MHNRRIGSEAADLNLSGSREGPTEKGHSHSEGDGEGRRAACQPVRDNQRHRDMLVSPQMGAASLPVPGLKEAGCSGIRSWCRARWDYVM